MKWLPLLAWASLMLVVRVPWASAQRAGTLYLKGGTIIDGTGRLPFPGNVVIRDGRIVSVDTSAPVPDGAQVVDVSGRYILPGFTDMHAHVTFLHGNFSEPDPGYDRAVSEQVLKTLLAYGVTTVRNPAAPAVDGVKLRDDVADGTILGPRILTAGRPFDGDPLSTENAIRAEVQREAKAGVNYIKVYASSTPQQTAWAIDEAHKDSMKVIGHLQDTDWVTAADLGIDFLTHAVSWSPEALPQDKRTAYKREEVQFGAMKARIFWLENVEVNGPEMDGIIAALKTHHISVDPTLVAYETKFIPLDKYRSVQNVSLAPAAIQEDWRGIDMTRRWTPQDFVRMRQAWPKMLVIVARYYREGVLLITGSDLPNPWVVPGVSLHQEMELLAQAGIPAAAVLQMSTRNAALALGLEREIGTVEAGKRADLVVLKENPLLDIRHTRSIKYVFSAGRLLEPSKLLEEARK